jgi:hypothetical protein
MAEKEHAGKFSVVHREGKRRPGNCGRRWKADVKMCRKEGERRKVWTGLIWLRKERNGELSATRRESFGLHKMRGIS